MAIVLNQSIDATPLVFSIQRFSADCLRLVFTFSEENVKATRATKSENHDVLRCLCSILIRSTSTKPHNIYWHWCHRMYLETNALTPLHSLLVQSRGYVVTRFSQVLCLLSL